MQKTGAPTEVRDPLKEDFRKFLFVIFTFLGLEPTPLQYEVAYYLQHGKRRRMVQAFRGFGKSWITAAYVLWRLYCNPQERILVVSANEDRALDFCIFVKTLIAQIEILQHLMPKKGARDSVLKFDVGPAEPAQAPSVRAVGITGQLTGGRATVIVSDDVEVPKNSATVVQREKLGELVKEYDAVLVPNGEIVYLGTPQTEESVYNKLPERGYDIRIWPARYPTIGDIEKRYKGFLAPSIAKRVAADPKLVGRAVDQRFTDMDLMEREASYGRSGFALQFMLDTSLSDAERYPLKLSDLIVMDVAKELAPVQVTWASGREQVVPDIPLLGFTGDRYHAPMYVSKDFVKFQGAVMVIDPSGRGTDETAYAVVKMLNGMLYITRVRGLAGGYERDTLEALARIAKEESVNEIRIESNYGDGMFTALFAPILQGIYPCVIEEYKVTGQKELRIIDVLEPALNQHRIVIDKRVLLDDAEDADDDTKGRAYCFAYQLSHITKDRNSLKHDDRLDATAEGVRYWTDRIKNDTQKAEDNFKAKLLDNDLASFAKSYKKQFGSSYPIPLTTKPKRNYHR